MFAFGGKVITEGQGPSTGFPVIMITAYGDADTQAHGFGERR